MSAAKPIANTVAIALGVFSIYGILGMQFLLGRLYSCSDPTVFSKEECVGVDASGSPLLWTSYPVNFDNLYCAVRSMFILATQDDWQSHMVPVPPRPTPATAIPLLNEIAERTSPAGTIGDGWVRLRTPFAAFRFCRQKPCPTRSG
jgi:hypothetical protein